MGTARSNRNVTRIQVSCLGGYFPDATWSRDPANLHKFAQVRASSRMVRGWFAEVREQVRASSRKFATVQVRGQFADARKFA